jgi:hypothetical protein
VVLLGRSKFVGGFYAKGWELVGFIRSCAFFRGGKWFQGMRMRKTTAADRERAGRPAGSLFCRDLYFARGGR